eukprot:15457481-Alexandrium_andersonii.AAC.1
MPPRKASAVFKCRAGDAPLLTIVRGMLKKVKDSQAGVLDKVKENLSGLRLCGACSGSNIMFPAAGLLATELGVDMPEDIYCAEKDAQLGPRL